MQSKFKTMIWLLGVCLIASTVIVACEEVNVNNDIEKDGQKALTPLSGGVVASNFIEVNKQIEWIAKGLTPMGENTSNWVGFKKIVHDYAEGDNFNEAFMEEIQLACDVTLGINFQNTHEANVNSYFSNNNYNKLYLPGFELESRQYINYIWVPDANTVDTTQQHVVCPYRTTSFADTTIGYYMDGSGQIDSLYIDWTDNPTDDYYIWMVQYQTSNPGLNPLNNDRESFCPDGHCDKETEDETCEDCDPQQNPSGVNYIYRIVLESIEINNDEKQYLESWLSNN